MILTRFKRIFNPGQIIEMKFIFLCLTIVVFSSCMSTKKYASIVNPLIIETAAISQSVENLIVEWSEKNNISSSEFIRTKKSIVPAILYWKWHSTIESKFDQNYIAKQIEEGIIYSVDNSNLVNNLNGESLRIKIKNLPAEFQYDKGGFVVIPLLYVVSGKVQEIRSISSSLS